MFSFKEGAGQDLLSTGKKPAKKAFTGRGTFAKNGGRKSNLDESDGTNEGEISNNSADVEEPDEEAVRQADNRHNLGAATIGKQIAQTVKPPSQVGALNNFAFNHGVGDASREASRLKIELDDDNNELSLSSIRQQPSGGTGFAQQKQPSSTTGGAYHSKKTSKGTDNSDKRDIPGLLKPK